jgi:ketosteroid isomerase-like protein
VSRENLELVATFRDRFNSGDFAGAFELCEPDVEFDWSRRLLDPVVLHGRDKARGFIEESLELFDQIQLDTIEMVDFGDDVLNDGGARFRGRTSGADVHAHGATIWTIRSGQIVRFRFYQTKEDALADLAASGVRALRDASQ